MRYFIADAAADAALSKAARQTADHTCLFSGPLTPSLAANAPYLIVIGSAVAFYDTWRRVGLRRNWGIFLDSDRGLNEVRSELRRFLHARLPDGRTVLFRFYDPRVFRPYIQSCARADLTRWFGLITAFYAEADDGTGLHRYGFDGATLSVSPVVEGDFAPLGAQP